MKIIITLFFCFLIATPCFSGQKELDIYGLTFLASGEYEPKDLPNKLDDNGNKNLNLGLSFGYDFRNNPLSEGFSPLIKSGFFVNLQNLTQFFFGAGTKYKANWKRIHTDCELGFVIIAGEDNQITYYQDIETNEIFHTDIETKFFLTLTPLLTASIGSDIFSKMVSLGWTSLGYREFTLFLRMSI